MCVCRATVVLQAPQETLDLRAPLVPMACPERQAPWVSLVSLARMVPQEALVQG